MAIRIEHQPSGAAVGMAAYAAGRGKARQRKQKYAMDLMQKQQARQDTMKYRMWQDQRQQERFNVGQQALQGRFKAGEAADLKRFEAGEAADKKRFDVVQGRLGAQDARRAREAQAGSLLEIPAWADQDTRQRLTEQAAKIQKMLLSGQLDFDNPAHVQAVQDEIDSYQAAVSNLKPPSAAGAENRDIVYRDATGTAYDEPGEGRTAYRIGADKPIEGPEEEKPEPWVDQSIAAGKTRKALYDQLRFEMNLGTDEEDWPDGAKEKLYEKLDRHAPALDEPKNKVTVGGDNRPVIQPSGEQAQAQAEPAVGEPQPAPAGAPAQGRSEQEAAAARAAATRAIEKDMGIVPGQGEGAVVGMRHHVKTQKHIAAQRAAKHPKPKKQQTKREAASAVRAAKYQKARRLRTDRARARKGLAPLEQPEADTMLSPDGKMMWDGKQWVIV